MHGCVLKHLIRNLKKTRYGNEYSCWLFLDSNKSFLLLISVIEVLFRWYWMLIWKLDQFETDYNNLEWIDRLGKSWNRLRNLDRKMNKKTEWIFARMKKKSNKTNSLAQKCSIFPQNAVFLPRNAVFFLKNIVHMFTKICNIFMQKYLMVNTGPISELRDYIWHFSSWVINVSLENAYIFLLYIWWTMTDTLHSDREWFQWERLNFTYW